MKTILQNNFNNSSCITNLATLLFMTVPFLVMAQLPTGSENYVKEISYQVKTTDGLTNDVSNSTLSNDDKLESISYYDGLGRPIQSIVKQGGGQHQDIITPLVYDGLGRQTKQYLPYADMHQPQGSGSLSFINQQTLLNNINAKYYSKYPEENWGTVNDVNAFSETIHTPNYLSKVLKQGAPGAHWLANPDVDTDHTIKFDYGENTANEVPMYDVIFPTGNTEVPSLYYNGYYEINQLSKIITKDENWQPNQLKPNDHTTEEFKDKQGRVILKRTYNSGLPHDTHYVYDDYGNLTYVLSPNGSDQILSQQWLSAFDYDILEGANGANITPGFARFGVGVTTTGNVMVNSYASGGNQHLEIDFNVVFSQSTTLKTGAITQLMHYVPDVVLGTIQATGGAYTIGVKDQTLYFSGSGTFTSINETLTVQLPAYPISTTVLDDLCYQYHYDHRNRLIEKKIPGKESESIVYDTLDRPVLTQDALLKANNQWLFTKYDALGRVAYTGLINTSNSRASMQNTMNSQNTLYEGQGSFTINSTNTYYTNNAYPQNIAELHTVNYYDTYNNDLTLVAANPQTVLGQQVSTTTTSLPTGSKVRVLTDTGNNWVTSVSYYDDKARPIYAASNNSYLNTTDVIETELDFTGKVLQTKSYHTKNGTTIEVGDTFTYDHASRLLSQEQQINNQTPETIVSNTYDELGQLVIKAVGGTQESPLQNVNYNYNIRGWLKEINDVTTLNNDLFGFQLNYANNATTQSDPLYNGNITDALWKTANDNTLYSYNYRYDALNRITDAVFNGGGIDDRYNLADVGYDKNGNHNGFKRRGPIVPNPSGGVSSHFGVMDDLGNLDYKGNQLLKVQDKASSTVGFRDGLNTNDDFEYDANGNMILDRNKGITNISYNHLNLPTEVIFNNNATKKITYIYDATGSKHKKEVNDLGNITNTVYAGNYIYENDVLKFFSHPEGYLEPNGFGYDYVYQYKDHLGNIRLSYTNPNNSYQNILESDLTNSMDGWVPNGQVGTEFINGSLKVNIDSAYEGLRHNLDHLTVSTGDVLNIRLSFDKGTTQSKVRLYFEELDSTGLLVGWDFLSTDLQTGVFEYTYTVTTANKLKLRIAKDNTNTNTLTHFFVDYVSVTSGALEIVEENNYYPFGMKHKGYNNVINGTDHPYGFGGMEEQNEFNGTLGWIDITARNYDPALGRWMNIDPLAETMRRHSPYNYAFDNPIFFMDPDGMSPIATLMNGGSINAEDVQNSAFGGNQISSASVTVSSSGNASGGDASSNTSNNSSGNSSSDSGSSNNKEAVNDDCCGDTINGIGKGVANGVVDMFGLGWEAGINEFVRTLSGDDSFVLLPRFVVNEGEETGYMLGIVLFAIADPSPSGEMQFMKILIEGGKATKILKGVNSMLPHAIERGVQHGIFKNADEASNTLKNLTKQVGKNELPNGTIIDPSKTDRILVPTGNGGMAAYQVGSNGTAKLKTVLKAKE